MCLILFAYHIHEKYKLIVAANRDEFYNRPTKPVHYWEDYPHILAGRDLHKMGTWMGVTKSGRFAFLTNYRDPQEKSDGKRSRGELVAEYLIKNEHPGSYMNEAAKKRDSYPGYNLMAGDTNDLYYYSNIEDKVQKLGAGIYGVSNHLLDTDWPKVKTGKEELSRIISQNDGAVTDQILELLRKADPVSDEMLPQTGVTLEWERILSPIFITSQGYGTRSSSVLMMTDEEIIFKERVYSGEGINDRLYRLSI